MRIEGNEGVNRNELELRCEDNSSLIWRNLFNIMAMDDQITAAFSNKSESTILSFFNQFHITDLCHFAPQDKAKAIHDIKDWKYIRQKVALHFLKEEVDLMRPKVTIT